MVEVSAEFGHSHHIAHDRCDEVAAHKTPAARRSGDPIGQFSRSLPASPATDCESLQQPAKARLFNGQLVLTAELRTSEATLETLTDPVDKGQHRVISVTASPGRRWYKRCRVHR